MKRPNIYSKPLEGDRTENYHPADLGGQYAKDLNKYIDYLKTEVEKLSKANVSGQLPLDFVKWYSGMKEEKILKAYERWKNESSH